MKKALITALSALLALSMAACSASPAPQPTPESKPVQSAPAASVATPVESEPVASVAEVDATQVLVEQDGIKITYKGIATDGFIGPEVKVLVENDTEKAITVQVRDLSINGFVVNTSMSADVPAGKKANDTISIFSSSLEENDIKPEEIKDIEFTFHVFESDGWDTLFDTEIITITI
ncbi:hypothetical protein LJC61_02590 [Ruminococcaceae bacterium OttesenSCG-928-A16]|nr:hypothetical protein [Ruminococcaceae bacterium OttesenSCG-928-A16]